MTNNKIQMWLDTARWAASGGNAQPWSVEYDEQDDKIAIHLSIDSEYQKNPSIMNVKGSAAAMALGCLATNLVIVANRDGYSLTQKIWKPEKTIWSSSVTLLFTAGSTSPGPLTVKEISLRRTDRNRFKKDPIPNDLQQRIHTIIKKFPTVSFTEITTEKQALISELSKLEKIRWVNKKFLSSMLSEIDFASKRTPDDHEGDNKIPASQLGAIYFDQKMLKLIRQFQNIGHFFIRFGLHRIFVMKAVVNLVKHSDRVIFLQAETFDFETCFNLGQCFQELWLEINSKQISFQPISGGLIALFFWQNQDSHVFSNAQVESIKSATVNFEQLFNMDLNKFTIGFRIGFPTKTSEKSPRRILVGHFKNLLNAL